LFYTVVTTGAGRIGQDIDFFYFLLPALHPFNGREKIRKETAHMSAGANILPANTLL
jgi:hypothetical protein